MSPNRKEIAAYGRPRDHDYVRVFRERIDGVEVVRVQWKEPNPDRGDGRPPFLRKTRGFDDARAGIAEAKAYAKGTHDRLGAPAEASRRFAAVVLRDLFRRYVASNEIDWRPATASGKRTHWVHLELHFGKDKIASTLTKEDLDALKKSLINSRPKSGSRKKSINQVRGTLNTVLAVYRWAIDHEIIPPTKLVTYRPKFAKNLTLQVIKTAEYSQEERAKISAVMDMEASRGWRVAVLTTLFRYCGPRKNAALHLEWPDVDFVGERIRWRIETDKQGRERWQPMPAPVREALMVAYRWSLKAGYAGRFVFFRPAASTRRLGDGGVWHNDARRRTRASEATDKPYTYSAYVGALHRYEEVAGVEAVPFKASHAFRRGIAGDVARAKGSKAAAEWIGDSEKIVDRHYVLERESELRDTAALVTGSDTGKES